MDAPRPSGTRRALLLGLPLAALAVAGFLVLGRDERPAPKARPSSAEPGEGARPQRRDESSAVPPAPPPAAAPASAAARQPDAAPALDADPEARVIERMRAALTSDPEEVLRLDDAASRDFGDSPRAAERGLLRVRALVRLDRAGQARSLAEDLIERYPDDPSARSAAAYMGVHPRPRGPSR
ncbi:tetratricopeptide repeat protein [Sorangium sp. So ce861]|uniref:tetratricopeptide repeat protein n=1 Tax=Sorangium sp. So ce861 TaxID=3133323 RepID=UPI003F61B07D